MLSGGAGAHEMGIERLLLRPDFARRELRGQVTLDPHRTRADPPPGANAGAPEWAGRAVIALLDRGLTIEIDGTPCRPTYEVRELWFPGAPTAGDTVLLRCALASSARRLRVRAEPSIDPLIVTVQRVRRGAEAQSHSVLIRGGAFTPAYSFEDRAQAWRPGGLNPFEMMEGRAASEPASAAPRSTVAAAGTSSGTAGFAREGLVEHGLRYLQLGFEHILPRGWDHVLFVASLVLGAGLEWRRLLWQLSAFTLAHTVTLALGTLGWIGIAPSVVEPLIALSLAVVALHNLHPRQRMHARTGIVFGFGLLHGLGFAGALSQAGIAGGALAFSLLAFNLGVELGQLCVVVCLLAGLFTLHRRPASHDPVVRAASVAIAVVGVWWAIDRLITPS